MRGVHAVLNQFDDRYNKVCGVVPVEEIVDIALVVLFDAVIDLFAERREQHNRAVGHALFGLFRKIKHIQLAHTVHREDQVKRQFLRRVALLDDPQRFHRRLGTGDRRRIR